MMSLDRTTSSSVPLGSASSVSASTVGQVGAQLPPSTMSHVTTQAVAPANSTGSALNPGSDSNGAGTGVAGISSYDSRLITSPSTASSYPRIGSFYPSTPYTDQSSYFGSTASSFYPPLTHPYGDLKESNGSTWSSSVIPQTTCYPYDSTSLYNPYGDRYSGMDSAARRKNATRETTNTLKAWLYEHRKNPYPTKGEKIMLAIITKMTLTQVSTWFANARRRLKKENKMTWEPRNKGNDGTNDNDDKDSLAGSEDNMSTVGLDRDNIKGGTSTSPSSPSSPRLDVKQEPDMDKRHIGTHPGVGHHGMHPHATSHLKSWDHGMNHGTGGSGGINPTIKGNHQILSGSSSSPASSSSPNSLQTLHPATHLTTLNSASSVPSSHHLNSHSQHLPPSHHHHHPHPHHHQHHPHLSPSPSLIQPLDSFSHLSGPLRRSILDDLSSDPSGASGLNSRPKIWSLAHVATSDQRAGFPAWGGGSGDPAMMSQFDYGRNHNMNGSGAGALIPNSGMDSCGRRPQASMGGGWMDPLASPYGHPSHTGPSALHI